MIAKPMKILELHYPIIQFLINTIYVTLLRRTPWNIIRVVCIFSKVRMYPNKNTSDKWDTMGYHEKVLYNYFIHCSSKCNGRLNQCSAWWEGWVIIVENTTTFPCSDWLCFFSTWYKYRWLASLFWFFLAR